MLWSISHAILHRGLCHKLLTSRSWNTNGMHNIPITFVMTMGMVVRGAEKTADWPEASHRSILALMTAFMDDITNLVRTPSQPAVSCKVSRRSTGGQGWSSRQQRVEASHSPQGEYFHRVSPSMIYTSQPCVSNQLKSWEVECFATD